MLTVTKLFAVPIPLLHQDNVRRRMLADLELATMGAYRIPIRKGARKHIYKEENVLV